MEEQTFTGRIEVRCTVYAFVEIDEEHRFTTLAEAEDYAAEQLIEMYPSLENEDFEYVAYEEGWVR